MCSSSGTHECILIAGKRRKTLTYRNRFPSPACLPMPLKTMERNTKANYMQMHTWKNPCVWRHLHAHTLTPPTHAHTHASMYTCAHIHTHAETQTHTQTHKYTFVIYCLTKLNIIHPDTAIFVSWILLDKVRFLGKTGISINTYICFNSSLFYSPVFRFPDLIWFIFIEQQAFI